MHQKSFIYLPSNVWLKPSEIGKVQSSRTLPISLEIMGAFHSTKTSGLNFGNFQLQTEQHFQKFPRKRTTSLDIPKFSKKFLGSFLCIQRLSFRNFKKLRLNGSGISEIQPFLECLETFTENFCTICRCFQILESYGRMEIKRPWCTRSLQDPQALSKGKALGMSLEEFAILGNPRAFRHFL